MNDLNSVILEGNLTKDPEIRMFDEESIVCKFTIAVNRYIYKKGTGEYVKNTAFFTIEAWGSVGARCGEKLKKGSGVRVSGKLRQATWKIDQMPRELVYVVAEHVEFKPKFEKNQEEAPVEKPAVSTEEEAMILDTEEVDENLNATASEPDIQETQES